MNEKELRWEEEAGKFYGFPACCIEAHLSRCNRKAWDDLTRSQRRVHKGNGFIPCINCADKIVSGQVKIEDLIENRICTHSYPDDPNSEFLDYMEQFFPEDIKEMKEILKESDSFQKELEDDFVRFFLYGKTGDVDYLPDSTITVELLTIPQIIERFGREYFSDFQLEQLHELAGIDYEPKKEKKIAGYLTRPQGFKGYKKAEINHPIYEEQGKYVIYFEPENKELSNLRVPYDKENFKSISHDKTIEKDIQQAGE